MRTSIDFEIKLFNLGIEIPTRLGTRANRSGIHSMRKMSMTIERQELLLLNWIDAKGLSSGIVKGFNSNAKLTIMKSCRFKETETISTTLISSA